MDEDTVEGQVELQEEYDANYEPTDAGTLGTVSRPFQAMQIDPPS